MLIVVDSSSLLAVQDHVILAETVGGNTTCKFSWSKTVVKNYIFTVWQAVKKTVRCGCLEYAGPTRPVVSIRRHRSLCPSCAI
jgi:hypothetical protein